MKELEYQGKVKGIMNENYLLKKRVVVVKLDEFCVYAKLLSIEPHGVWLEYKQKISFIAFNNIREITLDSRYQQ